ncbi:MAG: tRNA (N(6)-L-threonylcarbamoyladenosine(37)-C(2))-methylthiotransferase MtaB [Bacteroidales bacterium]|nr:tRNA (N(6)-L-threonylcarbamoyladenosine(37)-C(2))-methylthiotransferase MtaB [Bacteroidales bacterium]
MLKGKNKRVAIHTLGCKLNFSESSEIGRQLEDEGYIRIPFGEEADISVIHTCSVTGSADRKTRQAIRKAKKISPKGITVAMGCYAQLKSGDNKAFDDVDLVLGTNEKFNLSQYLDEFENNELPIIQACNIDQLDQFHSARSIGERTRTFLKVQDGCDYSCSYCTIPKARGKSRNPAIKILVEQVKDLVSQGIPEIVLTGVNTGDFGRSTDESFIDLLKAIDLIPGSHRFRVSSIEPNLLTEDIILFIKTSLHFTPHFHIPLQSGSDEILQKMSRRYLRETFEKKVTFIHKELPDASIGVDVIVGFPGESNENFEDAVQFLNSLPISYLHVFTYSERPGTPAADFPKPVQNKIRDDRSVRLHQLSDEKKHKFYSSQIGSIRWLVPEGKTPGIIKGFTENYIDTYIEDVLKTVKTPIQVRLSGLNKRGQMTAKII